MSHRALSRCFGVLAGWLALMGTSVVQSDELADLKSALERRIIDPNLPLTEVTDFTDARILPMPEFKTAAEWEGYAERLRMETLTKCVFRGKAAEWWKKPTTYEDVGTVPGGVGYTLRKIRYEVVPGLTIPALLYTPDDLKSKTPVALMVNGHDRIGKAADYKQIRCINMAKRGVIVLNVEWLGMGQLNTDDFTHYRMNQLDLCGTSGLAPFYLSMSRGIDILLQQPNADATRVAVSGLSGGGWQTIIISSLDRRVTLSNPVAGYSSFKTRTKYGSDLGDSEQTPVDLGATADYLQLTAIRAPKPTLLTFNSKDNCCFRADHALPPLMEGCGPVFAMYGKEQNLRSHVNEDPGDHNFGLDNRQQFYRMVGDHFFAHQKDYDWKEIACQDEVKTVEQLKIDLPEGNTGFNTLAKQLMTELPRVGKLPATKEAVLEWTEANRKALAEIVRTKSYDFQATADVVKTLDGHSIKNYRLRVGGLWTLPATVIEPNESKGTAVVIADAGRASTTETVKPLLSKGLRVVAVDPFYLGESKIAKLDFLWGLMVSTVGERPLGVQARQVAAVSAWAKEQFGTAPTVVSVGPRSSLIALTASALEPDAIGGVELNGSIGSLKEILEQNQPVTWGPESFCFGLLEQFDIAELAALSAPRPVKFVQPSDRVKKDLVGLKAWYRLLEKEHDPLAQ